ncbi:MAG: ABC transporter permease [Propionibacteriaceae bacterium]|jgi:ribose/xylose/arabinose/galactoside ABC-type transport system permease subunit|nr:ABC transporter permease [Propionibacteriaceae bacterium]
MSLDQGAAMVVGTDRSFTVQSVVRNIVGNHLIWPLLGLLIILGTFVDGFFSPRNLVNVLWGSTPLACMTLGMFMVMVLGALDLSIESTFAVAPAMGLLVIMWWFPEVPWPVAILTMFAVALVIGLVNGFIAVKVGVTPFLVTLATMLTLRGVVVWLIPEGVYALPAGVTYWGGARIFGEGEMNRNGIPVAIIIVVALMVVMAVVMNSTAFGKSVFAIGNNEPAAFVAGINVQRVKITCFVLAALFASVGGLLQVGRLDSVTATMGDGDIMNVFAAVTLGGTSMQGGRGHVSGILGAALLITAIENIMNLLGVEPSIRRIIFGLVLLAAICLASIQERMARTNA